MRTMKNLKEQLMHAVFLLSACVSILCVAMICVFLFANGIPAIGKIGVLNFLTGEKWKPGNNLFGILPMILGSIYVTAGARFCFSVWIIPERNTYSMKMMSTIIT